MHLIGSVIGKGLVVASLLISAGSAQAESDDFGTFWTLFNAAVGTSDQKAVSTDDKISDNLHRSTAGSRFPGDLEGRLRTGAAEMPRQGKARYGHPRGQGQLFSFLRLAHLRFRQK